MQNLKKGDVVAFLSVGPDEDDIILNRGYRILQDSEDDFYFIDEGEYLRFWPITSDAAEDGYSYEVLTLEND